MQHRGKAWVEKACLERLTFGYEDEDRYIGNGSMSQQVWIRFWNGALTPSITHSAKSATKSIYSKLPGLASSFPWSINLKIQCNYFTISWHQLLMIIMYRRCGLVSLALTCVRVGTHTHCTTKILLIGNVCYLRKENYQDSRSLLGGIKKT